AVSSSRDKGHAIGARSWKINRARFLLKRHFGIHDISISIQRNKHPLRIHNGNNESKWEKRLIQKIQALGKDPTRYPGP
ncbi:MAG: hypothetical protein ACE5OZ_26015, partial [Candidatus Heimdallarchaeota archaeon]